MPGGTDLYQICTLKTSKMKCPEASSVFCLNKEDILTLWGEQESNHILLQLTFSLLNCLLLSHNYLSSERTVDGGTFRHYHSC